MTLIIARKKTLSLFDSAFCGYLSAEQRLNYLVKINDSGKLYWAKNNQLVDTTAGNWKDAGDGRGIIPQNMPSNGPWFGKGASSSMPATVPGDSDAGSDDQRHAATHYAGIPKGDYKWSRYLRRHFTPRGMTQHLLRKTLKRNTWIYVTDKNFNIFIGIKGYHLHAFAFIWPLQNNCKPLSSIHRGSGRTRCRYAQSENQQS
ncbi:hypothetical protein BJ912DRAFT_347339 [Pholiota molesta]|nr:hypothetical protein BJ912DRAFT_347339 [Pholiota molesta]